jgi:hypothetical protein
MRKFLAITLAAVLAVFTCYEIDTYIHPRPAKAASTFGPIACAQQPVPVSITASTQVITAGGPNVYIYICAYQLGTGGTAETASVVEGTGTTCGTNTKAVIGGTTAAAGMPIGVSPLQLGGGVGYIAKTAVAGDNVCILVSSTATVSGVFAWDSATF